MEFFDYEEAAREAGVPKEMLDQWAEALARDYANDTMMIELRLLRACHAVQQGVVPASEIGEGLRQGEPQIHVGNA